MVFFLIPVILFLFCAVYYHRGQSFLFPYGSSTSFLLIPLGNYRSFPSACVFCVLSSVLSHFVRGKVQHWKNAWVDISCYVRAVLALFSIQPWTLWWHSCTLSRRTRLPRILRSYLFCNRRCQFLSGICYLRYLPVYGWSDGNNPKIRVR